MSHALKQGMESDLVRDLKSEVRKAHLNHGESVLVYWMGVDSGGPAQHVLEVKFFMIMHFYIKPFKPC